MKFYLCSQLVEFRVDFFKLPAMSNAVLTVDLRQNKNYKINLNCMKD